MGEHQWIMKILKNLSGLKKIKVGHFYLKYIPFLHDKVLLYWKKK